MLRREEERLTRMMVLEWEAPSLLGAGRRQYKARAERNGKTGERECLPLFFLIKGEAGTRRKGHSCMHYQLPENECLSPPTLRKNSATESKPNVSLTDRRHLAPSIHDFYLMRIFPVTPLD
jgi:hypothetical protein